MEGAPELVQLAPDLNNVDKTTMADKEPAIIIIGPDWHSCGSYSAFKGQVRSARAMGYATFFLALSPMPRITCHSTHHWQHYYASTADMGSDERGHTARRRFPLLQSDFWQKLWPLYHRSFAYFKTLSSQLAQVPENLREFTNKYCVKTILCNHYFNIPFAVTLKTLCPYARIALETHDVWSNHYIDDDCRHPLKRRMNSFDELIADEVDVMKMADVLVHLNEREFTIFSEHLPNHQHFLIFPDYPRNYFFDEGAVLTQPPFDFLIVADGNNANFRSLCWFLKEVWSEELQEQYSLKIVGAVGYLLRKTGDPQLLKFADCFLGRVDDVTPYYRAASTILLPTVFGHGISMKTIEALSFGKQFIATPLAFRGFASQVPEDVTRGFAATAQEFREQIKTTPRRSGRVAELGSITLYETLFSSEIRLARYKEIFESSAVA